MIDIWLIDAVLFFALLSWPFTLLSVQRPRLLPGSGIRLPELADHQSAYERRRRIRMARWAGSGALAAYLLVRGYLFPPEGSTWRETVYLMLGLAIALMASLCLAVVMRYGKDRRFIEEHPEFKSCMQPLGLRLGQIAVIVVPAVFFSIAIARQDSLEVLVCMLAALASMTIGRRLYVAAMGRKQFVMPPESLLGRRLAQAAEAYGYTPKRVIVTPSLVANGYALDKGIILITTALQVLGTEAEVAAVLAHEMSHSKDKDAKQIQQRRSGGALIVVTLVILPVVYLPAPCVAVPLAITLLSALLPFNAMWMAAFTHRLEFKCDHDTVRRGLGPELASMLLKMGRYTGIPFKWNGLDHRLLTHPDLAQRIKAIEEAVAAMPPVVA